MAEIAATTAYETQNLAVRHTGGKWSRQSSAFAVIGLSFLGWVGLGAVLQYFLGL